MINVHPISVMTFLVIFVIVVILAVKWKLNRDAFKEQKLRHEKLIKEEVLTDDPHEAKYIVIEIDNSVRWVKDKLYPRKYDLVFQRDTVGFKNYLENHKKGK